MTEKKIELPGNAFTHCPDLHFKLRRAIHCAGCRHFLGVTQVSSSGQPAADYKISCAHPIQRRIELIDI